MPAPVFQLVRDRPSAAPSPRALASTGLAALLACAVLLPLLGHRPLTDWDEGIYAEIAREMLATHTFQGFLVPHWNGHLWFEKPPLQMWLTAASLRIFGLNAFAARLPSALAGIATVSLLHAWLRRRFNHLTAWLGTLILLSAFGFQHVARVGETDTLLSLFCLIAVLGLAELLRNSARGWLLFWIGFALALMTKGAASITLPLTALALTALYPRHLLRHARTFTTGLLLFLALIVPWHAYMYFHFERHFLRDYIGFHTLTRATDPIEGHHTHPWFYVWVLLVSAPLFSLLYPWAIASTFRRKPWPQPKPVVLTEGAAEAGRSAGSSTSFPHSSPPELDPLRALAVFALITFALFTAAGTRLPHYIAPAYPPLSALTAAFLARLRSRVQRGMRSDVLLASAALGLYAAVTLLTSRPRKALHTPQFRTGYSTPDNRESVALCQQLQHTSIPLPPGPLLVWRQNPVVPLTTDAFYARRPAQQVSLTAPPPDLPQDPYFNDPEPLTHALSGPRLILLDTSLAVQLPANTQLQPLVTGKTQTLAILQAVRRIPFPGTP